MNKQWKKQAPTLMVAAIAVSGGARLLRPLTGGDQEQKPVVISAVMDYGVLVNGKEVAGTGYMNADAKQVMIPRGVYPRRSDLNWVGINRTDLRS